MNTSSSSSITERYRRDREMLLKFLISSPNLIKHIRNDSCFNSSLSDINFDTLSADYVLHCITNGGVLDVVEATKSYYHELTYPIMIESQSGNSYFTLSDTNSSGIPPKRSPPSIGVNKKTNLASPSSREFEKISSPKVVLQKDENVLGLHNEFRRHVKPADAKGVPTLGLPPLRTGLLEDDLRISAYEVLVASLVFSGVGVVCEQAKKRERNTKFLSGLKGKKDKDFVQTHFQDRKLELLNIVRSQMEISEAMDVCVRQRLTRCHSRTPYGQINIIQIVLGLLNSVSKSSFPYEKSYIQWRIRQANILEELCCPANLLNQDATIKYSIGKIRDATQWDLMSSSERAELLGTIRNFASKGCSLSEVGNENGHLTTSGYCLKIRLYEKLLLSVFDILEEGQLLAEADEILKLIKSTWSTLGITDIIHEALYSWVLFKQFAQTDVDMLLEYTTLQLQKVVAHKSFDEQCKHLSCTVEWRDKVLQLNLVPAILLHMCGWCDTRLQDYHRHFSRNPSRFKRILTFAILAGVFEFNELGELHKSDTSASRRVRKYIESSIYSAYMQAVGSLDVKSNSGKVHPLAILGDMMRLIADTEMTVFCPILHQWSPKAGMISATLLHQLFLERLKPFLEGISSLSQDVTAVLSASHLLDRKLTQLYSFASEENSSCQPLHGYLDHYKIGEISEPLILDWVISQHASILDWIARAFVLEEWVPLSSHQKHAVSIVEVFRMIEETVDQFFGLNLPVNITHLQALLSVIIHSFDAYMTKVIDLLVDKNHLYPPTPSLTRYEESLVAITRKKLVEPKIIDEKYVDTLNQLTISKLCIKLNTLQYIRSQIGTLEDGLRKLWQHVKLPLRRKWFNIVEEATEISGRTMSTNDESIDELFVTTFSGIRNSATDAITKIIDFIGAKVVFWDLREQFLSRLYHGGVERNRMETVLPNIDAVLNEICGLVEGVVRDPLILNIFRSLLEGYLRVLLDGGPSRAFSESDITLMEDDLNMLKDFFVADGEGLPRSTIERETKFGHQVLTLFSHQTSTVIQMLLTASEQISVGSESCNSNCRSLQDANTLIRVLCHKKDREASKFLKRQYQLPPSSEYEDNPKNESTSTSTSSSAIISDLLKRSASFRFPETGHPSIKSLRKKFQDAW